LVLEILTEGVWAEVDVAEEHLRLFSEHNAQGIQAPVYKVKTQKWIAPSELVDDIGRGKERTGQRSLPKLTWSALLV
jgi:hypothetical protein